MIKMSIPLVSVLLSGCANFYPPSRIAVLKPNTQYWASYDASRRGAWISTDAAGRSIASCAEPAPDVALSLATAVKAKGSAPGGPAVEGELSATATALALAGRDNVVLLARETLFRICEAAASGRIDQKDVAPLFREIIKQTTSIASAQADKSKAQTKQAAVEALPRAPTPEAAKALSEFIKSQ